MNLAHQLPFELIECEPLQTLVLDKPLDHIYHFRNGRFVKLVTAGDEDFKDTISEALKSGINTVFLTEQDYKRIQSSLQNRLRNHSRSLSIGEPVKNSLKHISLMTFNLDSVYENPIDTEGLKLLYQSSGNFVSFLNTQKKIIKSLYHQMNQDPFHYSRVQPLLSSLLLVGYCHYLQQFSDREIELLFTTSYFKDLGMCYLSPDTLNKTDLNEYEKQALKVHPYNTLLLLENRIPINKTSLEIISHHHFLSDQFKQLQSTGKIKPNADYAYGIETYLVAIFDMLTAMISERPYREKMSLFEALDVIKRLISDKYPHEYKALVLYIKHFFTPED